MRLSSATAAALSRGRSRMLEYWSRSKIERASSASIQASLSNALACASKWPTTVNRSAPALIVPPVSKPANRAAKRCDMTTSRLPGVNQRPSISFTCGRNSIPRGVTPRISVFASPDPLRRGALTMSTSSAEINGSPRSLRAISSKYRKVRKCSRLTRLPDSAWEPLRTTRILRASPVLAFVASMPRARARSRTTTVTTSAMPSTVASVARQRTSTFRRLYFKGRAMFRLIECFQSLHHTHPRHSDGRGDGGNDGQQHRHDATSGNDARSDFKINQEPPGEFLEVRERPESPGAANADSRAEDRQAKALGQNKTEQLSPAIAQRLKNSEFPKPFADGHAHGAHRHEQKRENNNGTDRADQQLHVPQHADDAHLERELRFAA